MGNMMLSTSPTLNGVQRYGTGAGGVTVMSPEISGSVGTRMLHGSPALGAGGTSTAKEDGFAFTSVRGRMS